MLLKKCEDLEMSLRDVYHQGVDWPQLHQELTVLSALVDSGRSPTDILNFISKNCLVEKFLNIFERSLEYVILIALL